MDESRLQEPPYALPLDTIIHGRYLIQEVIGIGGFGITYKGVDLKEDRMIAVKEYFPNGNATRAPGSLMVNVHAVHSAYRSGMDKFLQEARIIYHYSNANILRIYSLFEENNTAYYVMEFLTGKDLKRILGERGGKIPWRELKGIIIPIMEALDMIHADGVIHRDISPDNIFVCEDGSSRLIDFGTARSYSDRKELTVVLKKCFAPPEQYFSKGRQGPWTDVYAMGATIYRCVSGTLPPEAPERQRKDTLIPLRDTGADVPPGVSDAVSRALAINELERYVSMMDFRNDLDSFGDIGITAVSSFFSGFADKFFNRTISNRGGVRRIVCGNGFYVGQTINIDKDIIFGRDQSCDIVFPRDSAGVSRVHCQIMIDPASDKVMLLDCGSSYGTFLNGIKLTPGIPVPLENGNILSFGEDNSFRYETQ